ncbi:hypothetical protein B4Q13_17895, partial [Lacticaseibacillus rhamnosus]
MKLPPLGRSTGWPDVSLISANREIDADRDEGECSGDGDPTCGAQRVLIVLSREGNDAAPTDENDDQRKEESPLPVLPPHIFDELVYGVFKPEAIAYFQRVIGRLRDEANCDAVVLGCTEIPLILNAQNSPLPVLDSTRLLARAAHEPIIWPTERKVAEGLTEVYPDRTPPLRSDRDTILIGKGKVDEAFDVEIDGQSSGKPVKLSWKVAISTRSRV